METIQYGYAGKILHVNMTTGESHTQPLAEELVREYVGSTGICSKLAYDLIPPGTDPLSPENVLIVGIGPLAGSIIPGACRCEIAALSPLTGLWGIANSGVFGHTLKYAGYDFIVVRARAASPSFLLIEDNRVRVMPAGHLWGRDNYETVDAIWQEYPQYDVLSIGPGGERLVRYANVIGNKYGAFGRTGMGAVMGSKNLKAIVCKGTGEVKVKDILGVMRMSKMILREIEQQPNVMDWRQYGSGIQGNPRLAPEYTQVAKSRGVRVEAMYDAYDKAKGRALTCFSCPVGCKPNLAFEDGPEKGLKLQAGCGSTVFGPTGSKTWKIPEEDLHVGAMSYQLANRLGIDYWNAGILMRMALRLYEEGKITTEDTGGLEIKPGDPQIIYALWNALGKREGIGETFADGIMPAAKKLGRGAEAYATAIKKNDAIVSSPFDRTFQSWPKKPGDKVRWESCSVGHLVNPSGFDPTRYDSISRVEGRKPDALKRYAERIGVPEEEMNQVLTGDVDGYDAGLLTFYVERYHLIGYNVSECNRPYFGRILTIDRIRELLRVTTGIEFTAEDLYRASERAITIQRLFNIRFGWTKEDDLYPKGWIQNEESEREMSSVVERYYAAHGWTAGGIPPADRVAELGVDQPRFDPAEVCA